MPGLLNLPLPPGTGLLSPVIWDRLRQQSNPGMGLLGTEGGGRGMYGGGGRGMPTPQMELPLQGGRGINPNPSPKPPPPPPTPPVEWIDRGVYGHRAMMPSGIQVNIDKNGGTASVEFYEPRMARGQLTWERPSTQKGIRRFSDAFRAVKDYARLFQPRRIEFTAASDAHEKVYDRVAPMIARELGGELNPVEKRYAGQKLYRITLPGND